MKPQRKTIIAGRQQTNQTETAIAAVSLQFDDQDAINIHGLNVTGGASPFGPDETIVGRWYVVLMNPAMAESTIMRNQYITNLDTIASANQQLDSTDTCWGSGTFVAHEAAPFILNFSPKSSRNAKRNSRLLVIFVADAISGVVDDWDLAATISCFTSQ